MSEYKKEEVDILERILLYLQRNRVSTTEVADCLGKTGVLPDILPLNAGQYVAGKVKYIYAHSESNWSVHEQIQSVEPGVIVLCDAINLNGRAIAGELVVKYLHLYCQVSAFIAMGKMRDANDLIKNRYPVWCAGVSPVGCFNRHIEETEQVHATAEAHRQIYDGAIAVCDDTGVVIIPKEYLTEDFLVKLEEIERQEDIWFDCIDFRKWSTFETVCLKKYLATEE